MMVGGELREVMKMVWTNGGMDIRGGNITVIKQCALQSVVCVYDAYYYVGFSFKPGLIFIIFKFK